jgi:mannose/fructose/N-acetylgalactosamine-specific phosphotransferase system component IID
VAKRKHQHEAEFMAFVEKQSLEYVRTSADFIRDHYPGSADKLLPMLRKLYAKKRKERQALQNCK